jgi:hypothetical protein
VAMLGFQFFCCCSSQAGAKRAAVTSTFRLFAA